MKPEFIIKGIGLPLEFYEKMNAPINVGRGKTDPELLKALSKIISNLAYSKIKEEDAPMSASTHFNTALYDLLKLHPTYQNENLEIIEVLEESCQEIKILKGIE